MSLLDGTLDLATLETLKHKHGILISDADPTIPGDIIIGTDLFVSELLDPSSDGSVCLSMVRLATNLSATRTSLGYMLQGTQTEVMDHNRECYNFEATSPLGTWKECAHKLGYALALGAIDGAIAVALLTLRSSI